MSLHDHKEPGTIVAEIDMIRTARPAVSVLVVEGSDDAKFWGARIDHVACELSIAGGRPKLLEAAKRVSKKGTPGVLCVADADWDRLMGSLPSVPNVVFTDAHDLETTLCMASALRKAIYDLGDGAKIAAFRQTRGDFVEVLGALCASLPCDCRSRSAWSG